MVVTSLTCVLKCGKYAHVQTYRHLVTTFILEIFGFHCVVSSINVCVASSFDLS